MPLMSVSASSGLCWTSPWSTTAISSAVRRASVLIRQCSMTSSPSNRPSTAWVLPTSIVSSIRSPLDEVKADVERRRRMRQRSYRKVVDSGLGHISGPVQRQATAGLQLGPALGQAYGLGQLGDAHVVQQDRGGPGGQRLAYLLQRVALDLNMQVR